MEARERKTPLSPTCCFNFGYEDGGCFISKFQIGQTSDDQLDLYPAISVDLKASAVQVRIRLRSTSGNPPRTTIISRRVVAAVAVSVSVHGSASDLDCPIASIIWLDDGEQVQRRARKPINPTSPSPGRWAQAPLASSAARAGAAAHRLPSRGKFSRSLRRAIAQAERRASAHKY